MRKGVSKMKTKERRNTTTGSIMLQYLRGEKVHQEKKLPKN